MKLIAHRGNIDGISLSDENHPDYIDAAIKQGYDVEIDVRYDIKSEKLFLGHDEPQHLISWYWLAGRKDNLWIHCKNLDALYHFCHGTSGFNYFWHQEDYFTLTSKKYIWTYPGQAYTPNSVIVMPEWKYTNWDMLKVMDCHGICSDYVGRLK